MMVLKEDRAMQIAAMYRGEEEDEELDTAELVSATFKGADKYVSFVVDGKTITVPSVAYCSHLENQIRQRDIELAELKSRVGIVDQTVRADSSQRNSARDGKELLLLKSQMKAVRTVVNRHERDIDDVWRELDRKVNLRG